MKNKKVLVFILCLVLILSLAFVIADKGGKPNAHSESNKSINKTNEMTYGLCVANQTKVKNSCFKEVQSTYKICKKAIREQVKNETLTNKTEIKDMRTNCRDAMKNTLSVCKSNFKLAKENCIQYKCKDNEIFVNGTCVLS